MVILFSYALAQPCLCQENTCMVGVGLTSFLQNHVGMNISYSFGRHFSVKGEFDISYKRLLHAKTDLEKEHSEEFATSVPEFETEEVHAERITFNYWPSMAFCGFSLSAGVQTGPNSFDILTGAGYMFQLWDRINISTSINIPLINSIKEWSFSSRNLKIGIHYKF